MAVFAFGLQFGKLDLCLGLNFKLLPPGLEKSKKKKNLIQVIANYCFTTMPFLGNSTRCHGQASQGHYQVNRSVWKDLKFLLQIPLGMNLQTNIMISEHPGTLAPSLQNVAPWTEELHQLYLQISHMEKKKGSFSAAATPLWRKAQSWQTWHLVNSRRAALEGGGLNSSVSVISWAWEKVLELLKSIMGIKPP